MLLRTIDELSWVDVFAINTIRTNGNMEKVMHVVPDEFVMNLTSRETSQICDAIWKICMSQNRFWEMTWSRPIITMYDVPTTRII